MQSISCQSKWSVWNHYSTWRWGLSPNHSIPFLIFDSMSLAMEVGVNHCTRI
jgi:hypothetical protein